MLNEQTAVPARPLWLRITLRITVMLAMASVVATLLSVTLKRLDRIDTPAGFSRGLVHGALMPMSFPNLLIGDDVTIYAVHNNGIPYKLGYAFGVNCCGLIFFGLLFLRLRRLHRDFSAPKS